MPLPIWLAHQLARRLKEVRLQNILPYLTPDGKTQVGVEYRDRQPYRIHSITIIASQYPLDHSTSPDLQQLQQDIRATVIEPFFEKEIIKPDAIPGSLLIQMAPLLLGARLLILRLPGEKTRSIPTANILGTVEQPLVAKTPLE